VIAIAKAKAEKVAGMIEGSAVILASDTLVVSAGAVREKPQGAEEAYRFLEEISSGIPQTTYTGVAVISTETGARRDGVAVATVVFNPIPREAVRDFVESGRAFGHAGGWAIQDEPFSSRVREVIGELDAIIGLPKTLTKRLLSEIGFSLQS
ncbi:MAG: Maf family protein, partial [Parcubacteria group bacterium]|nr:Maf family protein [Parcubacteria group bacterium]